MGDACEKCFVLARDVFSLSFDDAKGLYFGGGEDFKTNFDAAFQLFEWPTKTPADVRDWPEQDTSSTSKLSLRYRFFSRGDTNM